VVEIGMGGSFDATNVAKEDIAIITNVAIEHSEYLGDTVAKIAADKAGIIKNENGVVITACSGEALEAIKARIAGKNTRLRALGQGFFARLKKADGHGTVFDYVGENYYLNLRASLAGRYQARNAALAVAAAEELGVEENDVRKGLENATNACRLETLGKSPLIVADAAHNPAGIAELAANLDIFKYEKLVCVFTAMKDKDWKQMLSVLAPRCSLMVMNEIKGGRGESAQALAKEAGNYTKALAAGSVAESIAIAKKAAGRKGMVLVCGSIYMLGQALDAIKGKAK